jgi:glycerol-3-phosphate dehydrogenase
MPQLSTWDRARLRSNLYQKTFDLLVLGGGATGAGIALDATSRGMTVALVERGDFASGTSSRSTKLIHGGVRYLEKAFKELDMGQYHLVREALAERGTLLQIAPHLTRALPLITPLYHRWEIPYYMAGLKMYEWLAANQSLAPSRYINRADALKMCPMLKAENLQGGVLFYDGQFDDARMNIAILTTAAKRGAVVGNYLSAEKPILEQTKVVGYTVRDAFTQKQFDIRARSVVNATGPYCDEIRLQTDPQARKILNVSSGAHLVLPRSFSARESGLLIPKTDDGRVLFLLPWLGHTLVGTTDVPARLSDTPEASEAEIDFILNQLSKYFSVRVSRENVLAAWAGLRPLVSPTSHGATSQISREHYLERLASGLITITGGKWTTYRVMAEETVDFCLKHIGDHTRGPSRTSTIRLTGAGEYQADMADQLAHSFQWDPLTAKYLARTYGDEARMISEASVRQGRVTLCPDHPHLESEIDFIVDNEFACTSADILCRRMRLGFLDNHAATLALARVNALLAKKLEWNPSEQARDLKQSAEFLTTLQMRKG